MRGYPKHLSTKDDYEFVRENFPREKWLPDWQNLLETMRDWITTGTVEPPEQGITDATHRVLESEGEAGKKIYEQQELQVIPTCKLLVIGFTEDYVRSVVEGNDDAPGS